MVSFFFTLQFAFLAVTGVHASTKPTNLATISTSGALSALLYTNVGGSGSYKQVTNMIPGTWPSCTAQPSCIQQTKQVSGPLAPFDDEITLVFRGPMDIYNIAVYNASDASATSWTKTSSWGSGGKPSNLVFMNNKGGGASGMWSICGGSSQSYANSAFSDAAASPQTPQGSIPVGEEMNIMTSTACSSSSPCSGFSRGTANHGWAQSKMFVLEFDMPSTTSSSQPPAIWALNAQVVRAAQYGCNCRGMGSPGGCGELDILENLPSPANVNQGISEIYSFKGATGTGNGNYFPRPTNGKVIYGVIFDVKTDQIAIQRWTSWDWTTTQVSRSLVDGYLGATAKVVSFGSTTKRRSHRGRMNLGGM
ncbi:hypothetical protein JAAARDRAFT_62898 [Jaapia argillacea MUCL 33604]|uniref:glucan endo-1,3-beta-D-glucosidase n=1 Tax=Jaapia argillacea MUCL 33604 TaxID=933084 RepID=A0A067PK89_9AGAM|nr:hypothetical protein JAAARDRAFT_62898 [Jaapia argillacea MUCL 33604]